MRWRTPTQVGGTCANRPGAARTHGQPLQTGGQVWQSWLCRKSTLLERSSGGAFRHIAATGQPFPMGPLLEVFRQKLVSLLGRGAAAAVSEMTLNSQLVQFLLQHLPEVRVVYENPL